MEQFVELMLATDRKAREMIDKARQAKAQAVADARARPRWMPPLPKKNRRRQKRWMRNFCAPSMRWTAALTQTATPGWTGCANACLRHKSMRCPV